MVHPIIGMRGVEHIADNARVLGLKLDPADLDAIGSMLAKAKGPYGDVYRTERGN